MTRPPRTAPRRPAPIQPPARIADKAAAAPAAPARDGADPQRIAKVMARAGVASRREAESMITEGRVTLNGKPVESPALNVGPRDRIEVDGQPIARAERARLWLHNKPLGLVTSARDEKGRPTVFDHLPADMPRVMPVGRLDLNSEGLLLLTNDGELKRKLELPATGWLRKYRVRVNGAVDDARLAPLRQGIVVEGERFQPMIVSLDRQQGANAWLTVALREGKNREIRRAMSAIGLIVNRLIRVSYGPFQLGELESGAVQEIRPSVLRDQLGIAFEDAPPAPRNAPKAAPKSPPKAAPGSQKTPAAEKPAPKSWGMKSHGGPRRRPEAPELETNPARVQDKKAGPKSWGTRSVSPVVPRRPRKD
jgi:23S rRNA pseudouridine2605 synthase